MHCFIAWCCLLGSHGFRLNAGLSRLPSSLQEAACQRRIALAPR